MNTELLATLSTPNLLQQAQTAAKAYEDDWEVHDDKYWSIVSVLWKRIDKSIFDQAQTWCHSEFSYERELGVDILSQLNYLQKSNSRIYRYPYGEQAVPIFKRLLNDTSPTVIASAINGLKHHEYEDEQIYLDFVTHSSHAVRFQVAVALGRSKYGANKEVINALIQLMQDKDEDVRNWATFSLYQTEADSAEIREAFVKRTNDTNPDARAEAIRGLVQLGDSRAKKLLLTELKQETIFSAIYDAAEELGDPELLPALEQWYELYPNNHQPKSAIEYLRKLLEAN